MLASGSRRKAPRETGPILRRRKAVVSLFLLLSFASVPAAALGVVGAWSGDGTQALVLLGNGYYVHVENVLHDGGGGARCLRRIRRGRLRRVRRHRLRARLTGAFPARRGAALVRAACATRGPLRVGARRRGTGKAIAVAERRRLRHRAKYESATGGSPLGVAAVNLLPSASRYVLGDAAIRTARES